MIIKRRFYKENSITLEFSQASASIFHSTHTMWYLAHRCGESMAVIWIIELSENRCEFGRERGENHQKQ